MKPAAIKNKVSSGGVIFRPENNSAEVALVAVRDMSVWCLPKGIIDRGEKPEETGLNGRIIEKIGDTSYWYYIKGENARCRKTVHFYLMEYQNGSTSDHDEEVNEALWFSIDEAIRKVSYKGDREILEKAKRMIEKGE